MEVKIEKANGQPLSAKDAEILFNYLKNKFESFEENKAANDKCKICDGSHDVEIFYAEDESYVYAAALCPGISKDRIEVFIDDDVLVIDSKPVSDEEKKMQGSLFFGNALKKFPMRENVYFRRK